MSEFSVAKAWPQYSWRQTYGWAPVWMEWWADSDEAAKAWVEIEDSASIAKGEKAVSGNANYGGAASSSANKRTKSAKLPYFQD